MLQQVGNYEGLPFKIRGDFIDFVKMLLYCAKDDVCVVRSSKGVFS